MELKRAYKQTEVGVIPVEWSHATIRGIASRARNAIVGGPFGSDLVSLDYVEDGVPVIRGQNMSGQWVSGNFAFVTPEKAKSLEANLAHPGDIVFTQRGTLGQVSLVPEKPFESYLVSQSQMKLSLNREAADPLFFFYVFTSEEQQKLIRGGTIQTGVPHVNLGILRDIPVQLPPLHEQRAIAAALGDVDALIGAVDRLIAKKRDLKQATMQQLLTGHQRLLRFSGKWETRPLSSAIDGLEAGVSVNSVEEELRTYSHDQCILKTSAVANGRFYANECKKIAPNDLARARVNPRRDTILISRMNTPDLVGESGYVDKDHFDLYLPDRLWMTRFRAGSTVCVRWLSYLLSSTTYKRQIKSAATGTSGSMKNIPKSALLSLLVPFPEVKEQTAIATVLCDMDSEIAALQRRRDKTRALKQGMTQELLTGRTRLV